MSITDDFERLREERTRLFAEREELREQKKRLEGLARQIIPGGVVKRKQLLERLTSGGSFIGYQVKKFTSTSIFKRLQNSMAYTKYYSFVMNITKTVSVALAFIQTSIFFTLCGLASFILLPLMGAYVLTEYLRYRRAGRECKRLFERILSDGEYVFIFYFSRRVWDGGAYAARLAERAEPGKYAVFFTVDHSIADDVNADGPDPKKKRPKRSHVREACDENCRGQQRLGECGGDGICRGEHYYEIDMRYYYQLIKRVEHTHKIVKIY